MALRSRRVVTGHDKSGKAVILRDDVPEVHVRARTGTLTQQMWITDNIPAEEVTAADPTGKIKGTNPPLAGSIFRILEIPAESSYKPRTEADAEEHRKNTGVEVGPLGKGKHPAMHRTRSIDYALILKGEIDMMLDDSEVHCREGDVLIQQGTDHAWANRGDKPCTIAFILIGAEVPW
jgi:mannose-6-phosphate isomerase-like protein (cupin superfamily)